MFMRVNYINYSESEPNDSGSVNRGTDTTGLILKLCNCGSVRLFCWLVRRRRYAWLVSAQMQKSRYIVTRNYRNYSDISFERFIIIDPHLSSYKSWNYHICVHLVNNHAMKNLSISENFPNSRFLQ
uniref:Uncharacterized protein n=1 Tax=Rhizophagus irregularis (strain DAOM 181602 / DAOM 197198 / MUCL 43194) TaxID=747089 RepID=U9U560_RHIID